MSCCNLSVNLLQLLTLQTGTSIVTLISSTGLATAALFSLLYCCSTLTPPTTMIMLAADGKVAGATLTATSLLPLFGEQ